MPSDVQYCSDQERKHFKGEWRAQMLSRNSIQPLGTRGECDEAPSRSVPRPQATSDGRGERRLKPRSAGFTFGSIQTDPLPKDGLAEQRVYASCFSPVPMPFAICQALRRTHQCHSEWRDGVAEDMASASSERCRTSPDRLRAQSRNTCAHHPAHSVDKNFIRNVLTVLILPLLVPRHLDCFQLAFI